MDKDKDIWKRVSDEQYSAAKNLYEQLEDIILLWKSHYHADFRTPPHDMAGWITAQITMIEGAEFSWTREGD